MHATAAHRERLFDLLADRAIQGLSTPEEGELASLLATCPNVDESAIDATVAEIDLAMVYPAPEPMPPAVRRRVETTSVAWLAGRRGLSIVGESPAIASRAATTSSRWSWWPWLATAAAVMLAVTAWWPTGDPPTASARRQSLLGSANDAAVIEWALNEAGVRGDIVWSNDRQEGFMTLKGLPVNDPTSFQYQLWIFDAKRSVYNAVDGGVFDVDTAGRVIVPIAAKLPVFEPTLFAVTSEPPGGVVKHDPELDPERFRIVLTASVG